MDETKNNLTCETFGAWFRASLAAFAVVGIIDWALAVGSSTGVGTAGFAVGAAKIVALWMLAATVWACASGVIVKAATGRGSPIPLIATVVDHLRRAWKTRHDDVDINRLATFVAGLIAFVGFAASSIAVTTRLIEDREVAHLIAGVAFVVQLAVAAVIVAAAAAIRRALLAIIGWFRGRGALRWINFPTALATTAVAIVTAAVATAIAYSDVFVALEGHNFALVGCAIAIHLATAYHLERAVEIAPMLRRALWIAPLLAIITIGSTSQQPEVRRLVVLHGEASQFAFHHLHRHANLDRVFDRSECPPIGHDGTPVGELSAEEFEEQCLDPAYDRPFQRREVPDYQRPEFDEAPSVVLITWDSVRIDRLGFRGHDRDTTPNLDTFAADNLVFDRAFTQDSGTGPSFWSMMAGKTPFQVQLEHGHRFPPPISEDETMLGELLEEAGYHNEAVLCGTVFEREYWGIRWGFERFENVCGNRVRRVAPTVTDEGIEAVERLADGDDPFFLWVHYWDPHIPYIDHPDIGWGSERLDRYDEELRYTDRHFGKLLEAIDDVRGGDDRPIYTIFSADHGENFDEHGSDPHARNLYRIVTHVPKIVDGPGVEARHVEPPVAMSDIYPTVLDLAGVDIPDDTTMISQVPVYFGAEADEERMVFQENSYSRPRRHTRGVVYDRYHFIMDLTTHTEELYDYVDDPIERNNLVGTGLVEEQVLRQALIRFLETSTIPEGLED